MITIVLVALGAYALQTALTIKEEWFPTTYDTTIQPSGGSLITFLDPVWSTPEECMSYEEVESMVLKSLCANVGQNPKVPQKASNGRFQGCWQETMAPRLGELPSLPPTSPDLPIVVLGVSLTPPVLTPYKRIYPIGVSYYREESLVDYPSVPVEREIVKEKDPPRYGRTAYLPNPFLI